MASGRLRFQDLQIHIDYSCLATQSVPGHSPSFNAKGTTMYSNFKYRQILL